MVLGLLLSSNAYAAEIKNVPEREGDYSYKTYLKLIFCKDIGLFDTVLKKQVLIAKTSPQTITFGDKTRF